MSGSLCASYDHYSYTGNSQTLNQEFFTNLFWFLNGPMTASGYTELVALNYGSANGSVTGDGTNYWDISGDFGENAWAVFRFPSGSSNLRTVDMYALIQWADSVSFGTSPGNPGLINAAGGADGTGMQIACMQDGSNPWEGTTNADGSDTKGDPVWNTGSNVCPKSNDGGDHDASKENCVLVADVGYQSAYTNRYHFAGDVDSIAWTIDMGANVLYNLLGVAGAYESIPALSGVMACPLFMLVNGYDAPAAEVDYCYFTLNTTYGGNAGSLDERAGGVYSPGADNVVSYALELPDTNLLENVNYWTNVNTSGTFDTWRPLIYATTADGRGVLGYVPDTIYAVNKAHSSNTVMSSANGIGYAVFGGNNYHKVALRWDPAWANPGAGTTREGTQEP